MSSFLRRFATPTYKNTGSTARDHLASERTFLAWLRTGLGFIALGIAIERFSTLEPLIHQTLLRPIEGQTQRQVRPELGSEQSKAVRAGKQRSLTLSLAFAGVGTSAIVYGTHRYLTNMRNLQKGLYKPAFWGIIGFVSSVLSLSGYGLWDTFLKDPEAIADASRAPAT